MKSIIIKIASLLSSTCIILLGNGLLSTLLVLRGIEEGFQEGTIGFFMSMYFTGFISGTFIVPKIINRVGHIRTLSALSAILAGVTILQGLWISVISWSIIRFITGASIVGFYMVIESWLNAIASNENRGRIMGIYQLLALAAIAASQYLLLLADIRMLDLFAISATLVCFGLIPVALTRIQEPDRVLEVKIRLRDLYLTSPLGFIGCFISGLIGGAFWGLGPLFAKNVVLTEFGIATFMSVTVLGGVILQLPVGLWSDRHDRRLIIIFTGFVSAIIAMLTIFSTQGNQLWLYICMFLFGGMFFSFYPLSVAHSNDHPGDFNRVTITTNLLLTYGIGAVVGPVVAGTLMYLFGHTFILGYFMVCGLVLGIFASYRKKYGMHISITEQTSFIPQTRTSQVMAETVAHTSESKTH